MACPHATHCIMHEWMPRDHIWAESTCIYDIRYTQNDSDLGNNIMEKTFKRWYIFSFSSLSSLVQVFQKMQIVLRHSAAVYRWRTNGRFCACACDRSEETLFPYIYASCRHAHMRKNVRETRSESHSVPSQNDRGGSMESSQKAIRIKIREKAFLPHKYMLSSHPMCSHAHVRTCIAAQS